MKRLQLWLVLAATWMASTATATEVVYTCKRDGISIHQGTPCGEGEVRRVIHSVAAQPASPPARRGGSSRTYTVNGHSVSAEEFERAHRRYLAELQGQGAAQATSPPPSGSVSYRCTSNDMVFYSHAPCERKSRSFPVIITQAEQISRADACAELTRAGAGSRYGNSYDDKVSTYDKNRGQDPCR